MEPPPRYDAVLVVSFGGPERPDDVMPFLENVLRGKDVPRPRLLEVAQHYFRFGGYSPISAATRALIAGLRSELELNGPRLPVYGGNRNWHPLLPDTLRAMAADGIGRALALVTSAFGSYSGCRQYLDDIERARAQLGPAAPRVDKIRLFYNHPEFLAIMAERVRAAASALPVAPPGQAALIFTAHSIPVAMAASGPYRAQLEEACTLIATAAGYGGWRLAFQSRSGPPQQPWLEPSLNAVLVEVAATEARTVVLVPVGFLSDHMEVVYDLDLEARDLCDRLGLRMTRAETAGAHPRFPALMRELIRERVSAAPRRAVGAHGPWGDTCPRECCRW